jgi:murein L,D-transpeptidase YafK
MPKFLITFLLPLLFVSAPKTYIPDSKRAADIRSAVWPKLQKALAGNGLKEDQPIYIRVFKEPGTLEIWVKSGKQYKLFKQYLVCTYSGGLGTKTRDHDGKCPEGFYSITPSQLNPVSNYHLAINVGYPNNYDQQHGYTGNAIMIHGDCRSIGCYAMTDPMIEEIYTMVYEAFLHGQKSVDVAIFPFKLTNQNIDKYSNYPYVSFWQRLKPGYDIFEYKHVPPVVSVVNKTYKFGEK